MKKLSGMWILIATMLSVSCYWEGIVEDAPGRYVAYLPKNQCELGVERGVLDLATHVDLAFFNPDESGQFILSEDEITSLKHFTTQAHQAGVKVLISIGGGLGLEKTSPIIAIYDHWLKPENRNGLIDNLAGLVDIIGADGIDNDLEDICITYHYDGFVQALSKELKTKDYLLTAAVAPYTSAKISDATFDCYDFINLMAYDYTGLGSDQPGPLADISRLDRELYYYGKIRGIHPHKIVVGLPFYGYWWKEDSKGNTIDRGAISYSNLVEKHSSLMTDSDQLIVKESDTTVTYCYNTAQTIKDKIQRYKGYGGMMCWHFTMDSELSDWSLNEVLRNDFLTVN
jgi:chitinase